MSGPSMIRRGIRPKQQAGRMNFYADDVVDLIREPLPKSGRPKKKNGAGEET
jgi:hypothetical protein